MWHDEIPDDAFSEAEGTKLLYKNLHVTYKSSAFYSINGKDMDEEGWNIFRLAGNYDFYLKRMI